MPLKDLRAPSAPQLKHLWTWRWRRVLLLVLSDSLALVLAWRIARWLNQFFSPIPPQLVWWVWFGLPSLFWILIAANLLLFAQNGLYGGFSQVKNYLKAGKLVSLLYLASLIVMYFYDPKLDPPRSLFFTAWFGSVTLVILSRLVISAVLRPFEQAEACLRVFIVAPAKRLKGLSETLQRRSRCLVVGAALAATANSSTTHQAILTSRDRKSVV